MSTGSAAVRPRVASGSLLERVARRVALAAAERLTVGRLTVALPDGSSRTFGRPGSFPQATIEMRDAAAVLRMFVGGEIGVGEAYMDGSWCSPDLPSLLRLAVLNREAFMLSPGWVRAPLQVGRTVAHRMRRNTRAGSRRNIAAHYDLGNDFYRLFLDETLTYSSAVFASADQPLADAQRNKYRIIAERARLDAGMHVLEIGTGWGGFALYAAGEIGCRVTTITISRAQQALAAERVRAAGLAELVTVELKDYRDIEGVYDAIVSIEMLEAVGAEYYATFFDACDRALVAGGIMSLQSITFPDAAYEAQRRGANWIQTYIFPGGLLPSLAAIERAIHGTKLIITSSHDIAQHYVLTLAAWRKRFLAELDTVRAMGFDERFIRMWEYYLAVSEAGFATGMVQDQQIVFEKRRGIVQGAELTSAQERTSP